MQFRYVAVDSTTGRRKRGSLEAPDEARVVAALKEQGMYVLSIKAVKNSIWHQDLSQLLGRPVKMEEFVAFCRQLATLIRTGTTLSEALELLQEQVQSKTFKGVLRDVWQQVRAGRPLSVACAQHPRVFEPLFVHMIQAGEMGGQLDAVLEDLAQYYERSYQLKERVKTALVYPVLVSLVGLLVVLFLLVYVIPRFVDTLAAAGADLPWPTVVVLTASRFVQGYWYVLLALAAGGAVMYRTLRLSERWRLFSDHLLLKLPIFGRLIYMASLARLLRTLASLLSSAVPVLDALGMTAKVVGNRVLAQAVEDAQEALRQGESLSTPFVQSGLFPPMVIHMIKVGEASGQLDELLAMLARFYEAEVEQRTSRLSTVLEPVLIIILAVVVGTIVLAALLPMLEIYRTI